MRRIKTALVCLALLSATASFNIPDSSGRTASATPPGDIAPSRPFPQHVPYRPGTILPDHISQETMDDSVRSFYKQWKQHYIRYSCAPNEAYVWFEGTRGTNICVSEGQGYGMMIVALMAGYDPGAQATYDALFNFYKSHPATTSAHLMAWTQTKDCQSLDGGTATDGDMDIAYSLLLADAQWGTHTTIPYREEALEMINAIRHQEVNPDTYIVMESNGWSKRSKDYFDMRSSDFMPDHLRAFRKASGDPFWDTAVANNYKVFRYLQDTYSPEAGLVPDFIKAIHITPPPPNVFITGTGGQPPVGQGAAMSGDSHGDGDLPDTSAVEKISAIPAQPHYLESQYDGLYNFNACRVPWRIATDFLLSGDPQAAAFLSRLNPWIRTTTQGKPNNISAGYNLSGEDLPHRYFEALCFICPFAVAATASQENQQWLNKLWDYIVQFKRKDFDYYDNSIKMINLIILSGNYWAP